MFYIVFYVFRSERKFGYSFRLFKNVVGLKGMDMNGF